jgi:outer membrane protein assembly factor BamB
VNEELKKEKQVKPLRLLPGVIIVILQWLIRFGLPVVAPGMAMFAPLVGPLAMLALFVWWGFFSRAPGIERWGAVVLMIAVMAITSFFIDESIRTGLGGMMFFFYASLGVCLAFVAWAVACGGLSGRPRFVTLAASILLASGIWILLRCDGINSSANPYLSWRWAMTPEEKLMDQLDKEPLAPELASAKAGRNAEWPGFRGPERNSIVRNVRIKTDWSASPPEELWRRPVGPACSSFAVSGDLLFTQEQRGENEIIACYYLPTGKPIWIHRDRSRFWDSHAGAGPRSTPTLKHGRVYTMGATGIVNVLDARSGAVVWSRNAADDTKVKIRTWGFTSSPLVTGDVVIVAVEGELAAYDRSTGKPKWFGPDGGDSFSSPHLLSIRGIPQVLLMRGIDMVSFSPANGKLLWKHALRPKPSTSIVQPALLANNDLLINEGDMAGMSRIAITRESGGWTVRDLWKSSKMKPNFNDFVVHKGHAFGLSSRSLVCIDIKDGRRKWKSGRYGGQLMLLADQGLLLVVAEKGELVLVKADPDRFEELARVPGITGKTWNHPAMAGNILLVRNTREMAAFRLFP